MKGSRRLLALLVLAVILAAGSFGYLFVAQGQSAGPSCSSPLGSSKILRTQTTHTTFDAVTKFPLPSPLRDPNGIIAAPDGSVWFGEQAVPGLAHFFPANGTLVEYAWPFNYAAATSSGNNCAPKTEIWGLALWNGKVWASDGVGNQLVGLDPSNGVVSTIRLSKNNSFPYILTVGPDRSLWFTELFVAQIGRVDLQGNLHEYSLPEGSQAVPSEIVFVNSTLGYYVDAGEAGAQNGGVFAFNPNDFTPVRVGGNTKLSIPTSVAIADRGIWVTLHGASSLAFYSFDNKSWSSYPTSTVSYTSTTLPYFVKSNGSAVWFNEHFGNKLAMIDPRDNSLTEYSLSNPAAANGSSIDNALTFALAKDRAWFTEWTANYIGYVYAGYQTSFTVTAAGGGNLAVKQGGHQTISVQVSGQSPTSLSVQFSDSERTSAKPDHIRFSPSQQTIAPFSGSATLQVTITTDNKAWPGNYTLAITVTNGLISRSVYLNLSVSSR